MFCVHQEQGGKIVSVLTMEYNGEVAKRVYADEQVENRLIEVAKKLLKRNRPIEEIMEYTGLEYEEIEILRANI